MSGHAFVCILWSLTSDKHLGHSLISPHNQYTHFANSCKIKKNHHLCQINQIKCVSASKEEHRKCLTKFFSEGS